MTIDDNVEVISGNKNFRGLRGKIIQIIGSKLPFHFMVFFPSIGNSLVFRGDEIRVIDNVEWSKFQ